MPAYFSALGMLMADLKHDYVQTFVRELTDTSGAQIADAFAGMENSATETLREEGCKPEQMELRRFLDMRYRGQEYTLSVSVTEDLRTVPDFSEIRTRFDQMHQDQYGHSAPEEPVMMVNLRLSALGKLANQLPMQATSRPEDRREQGSRRVIFDTTAVDCPIYLRSGLEAGDCLEGPAVIEELGATILVYPGDSMQVNEFGQLVIEVRGG